MHKKIMVPLDGSELSECSLDQVKDFAQGRPDTEIVLISVLEYEDVVMEYNLTSERRANEFAAHLEAREAAAKKKLEDGLNKASDNLKKTGLTVNTVMIQAQSKQAVADVLLDYAQKNQVDLIIMSTHGHSGISRFAFGSVANQVVHYSKIPVLTVTPSGCRV